MRVALVYGGKSGEHEVSLVSAASVARNMDSANELFLIAITKAGRWFLQGVDELRKVVSDKTARFEIAEDGSKEVFAVPAGGTERTFKVGDGFLGVDVVFPVLHGTFGEDGTIQGLFEMVDVPYVGCGVCASALTMDKEKTKRLLSVVGIPVVPGVCVRRADLADWRRYDALLERVQAELGFPLFVKPCAAGSSNGASLAKDARHLNGAIMEAFLWDDKILIEKAIDAREIECSVTGNPTAYDGTAEFEKTVAYGPGEISPKHAFYDYDAKYNDPDGAELLIPANLSDERCEEIRALAKKAYEALDLNGLSRVDFFIDRKDGAVYLNEINTMPGFTQISLFPRMCETFGLSFKDLTTLLMNEATARFKKTRGLCTSR